MKHQNTIAIIGAAERGGEALVKKLLHSDNHLLLLASDQAELRRISKMLKNEKPIAGISLIDCIKDGCWEADVVVLAIPEALENEVAGRINEVVTQKIVISMKIAETIPGNSIQKLLPNAKVVIAQLVNGSDGERNLVISGDDELAVQEASDLLLTLNVRHSVAA